jgi:thioredoxin reductase
MQYDLIIVGGGFAGLSAATQAARARRKVLVVDAGMPRNRFAAHSHGFLANDGKPPREILDEARRQLMAYPTAGLVEDLAEIAEAVGGGFAITTKGGERFTGSRLLIATGVRDHLPDMPGLAEQWGKRAVHCPYCHGYEIGGGRIGVLATGSGAVHQALLVADWGEVTLFTQGVLEPDAAQMETLSARGVQLERAKVTAVEDAEAEGLQLRLEDGRAARVKAIFVATRTEMASPLAEQLGCAFTDGMLGPMIKVDERQQTSVPGVYAAGDAARAMHNIAFAVADGAFAGVAAHQSLVFG